jgi:hypothetical protein
LQGRKIKPSRHNILGDNLNNYENGMVCVFIFENEIFP